MPCKSCSPQAVQAKEKCRGHFASSSTLVFLSVNGNVMNVM